MDYFARFTEGAKKALGFAAEYAKSFGHNYVGTEHVLIGIAAEGGRAADMLAKYGIDAETLKEAVLKVVGQGDYVFNGYFGYTPRVKMILELSQAISRQLGTNYVLSLIHIYIWTRASREWFGRHGMIMTYRFWMRLKSGQKKSLMNTPPSV